MESSLPGTATATPVPPPAARRSRWQGIVRAICGLLFLALVAEILRIAVGGNFDAVIPGQIYRSAQPWGTDVERVCKNYGVQTVVNLRGRYEGMDWYDAEARACQDLGLSHENLTFSALRVPCKFELLRLIEVIDRAERPLLLHCRQGADRTGLAAAVALLLTPDVPYSRARANMGLRWGHWHWGPAGELAKFFEYYEEWLASQKIEHSPSVFRQWVAEHYQGGACRYEVTALVPGAEVFRKDVPISYRVRFRNTSPRPWEFRPVDRAGHRVGFEIVDADGVMLRRSLGGVLNKTVPPGEEIEMTVAATPLPPGRYRMRIDLFQGEVGPFSRFGQEPIEQELIVRE